MKNIDMNQTPLKNKIEEALQSLDAVQRATPRPFLMTRIHARMNKESLSVWERVGELFIQPRWILTGLCLVLAMNAAVVLFNNRSNDAVVSTIEQTNSEEDYSTAVATLYDLENNEP